MAVRDGEDRDRGASDPEVEAEQLCLGWASELMAPALVGDAPRILLDEVDGIEVWGLITPWEAEELVDHMEDWPIAPKGIASA